ncbi:MAG: methyltransferase domain-containing protein [Acidobacteriota bacterium]|nr:methyltransferase domain-containing protein [Acidobacteriota bacterium]
MSDNGRALRVLEVGPGTGSVTRQIVASMTTAGLLDLVEINSVFIKSLLHDLKHDAVLHPAAGRITLFQIPVERLDRVRRYDVIVSGLPLNNFSVESVEDILDEFRSLLMPGGTLSFFEYVGIRRIKSLISGRCERRRLWQISVLLERMFATNEIRRDFIFANIPPAWVHHVRF